MTATSVSVAPPQARHKLRQHHAFSLVLAALPTHAAASPQAKPATNTIENGWSAAGFTLHLYADGTVTKQGFVLLDGLGLRRYQLMRHLSPTANDNVAAVIAALGQRAAATADEPMPDCCADGSVRITANPAMAGFASLTSGACMNEKVAALYVGILEAATIDDLSAFAPP